MKRIIIIDDTDCKQKLDEFLKDNMESVKLNSTLNKLRSHARIILEDIIDTDDTLNKITVVTESQLHILKISNIIRIEAMGIYTSYMLKNNVTIKAKYDINLLDKKLVNYSFLRIHDHHLINVNFISKYYMGETPYVKLVNGEKLYVQNSRNKIITEYFDKLSNN
ncbi:MAG: LytTR family transcriptional regulator [Bacteroidales bacterium]|nr:LytTR family transcriptional regulator [Bacteroidales bacterium]